MIIVEAVGWAGTILILVAYYLVSVKKVSGDSNLYQGMNLAGAVALNVIWGAIAVKTLLTNRVR